MRKNKLIREFYCNKRLRSKLPWFRALEDAFVWQDKIKMGYLVTQMDNAAGTYQKGLRRTQPTSWHDALN